MRRVIALFLLLALHASAAAAQTIVVEYYHVDAVGSVRAVTDAGRQVVRRHDYLPFGEENGVPGADARRFTGKERDQETFLDYFGARYYDSRTGRFTTVDPALDLEAAILDPQRWNRYAYALNNPLKFTDPDGRSPKLAILALKAGHALYKGYDIYSAVEGIVEAGGTVISGDATAGERVWAGVQLAGELSGVTDLLKAGRGILNAVDAVDAARDTRTVIGRVSDLKDLRSGERSLLDRLPDQGSPKANWKQNAGVLREEMKRGLPIRDASPGDRTGRFLTAERNLLRGRGWTFDAEKNLWMPPKK